MNAASKRAAVIHHALGHMNVMAGLVPAIHDATLPL